MVRNYKRKTDKKSWTRERLANALKAIRVGSKIRAAARNFDIPESTLRDHLKGNNEDVLAERAPKKDNLGRNPVFTREQEQEIVDHVVTLGNLFYGVTPRELRRMAFDFAEANRLPHKFNAELKLAGKDWLMSFQKRNPQISLRQPEGTSINRIAAFNAEAVGKFFNNLKTVLLKHEFRPDRIFNVDESGITTVQKKSGKVYAKKGQKQVGVAISAERGQTITILCAVSAAGSYIPPMLIYPRKRMSPQLEKGGPIGCVYACSNNGWSNDGLFLCWLKHFQSHVKASDLDPVLLILDNHCSHISLAIYNYCKENRIVLLSIPPHTSNHLQPLDLTFFGPLKRALFAVYDSHMISTAHEKITMYDVASLLNQAYMKVATMEKGISGFRAAGILPLDPRKFTEEDFAPAQEFRELILDGEAAGVTDHQNEERSIAIANLDTPTLVASSEPSCSSGQSVKISEVSPIPLKKVKKTTRRRAARKQYSEILTATPMKVKLLEKKEKQDKKKNKEEGTLVKRKLDLDGGESSKTGQARNLKGKRKRLEMENSDEDSEEVDDVDLCEDSDSSTDSSDEYRRQQVCRVSKDACMLCGEFGRNNELWYRCIKCGIWTHSECSGWDTPAGYTCDNCSEIDKNNRKKR